MTAPIADTSARKSADGLVRVPVTTRTTWLLVQQGRGWGELSDIPEAEAARLLAAHGCAREGLPDTFEGRTVAGGLATAEADAAARAAGLPLADWLAARIGRPVQRRVIPLYANINRALTARTPQAAAALAREAVAAGHTTVKIAPFDGLTGPGRIERGLELAHAVREAIGSEAELLLDAHHLLSVAEVIAHARVFTELRLGRLEDSARLDDVPGLHRVRDAIDAPLAGGEVRWRAATASPPEPLTAAAYALGPAPGLGITPLTERRPA
ncbi:hypothetical protein H9Y04_19995 [Streptomyces sp. TRM66268-LWL]|uniref:Mandelate racemase/muconate lactonizing enzyme C-terminal domain-containing protein n=1 Tax=Streptomyces polyasparticus TaxID=2767826 RepID=A0ABR7SJR9_9ACTN|nr:enolase C-terminal domain-like protein [Streptomyces polyasparticus]MBC9714837.1 hypothetical protein [Streptomyces polyasparticus]